MKNIIIHGTLQAVTYFNKKHYAELVVMSLMLLVLFSAVPIQAGPPPGKQAAPIRLQGVPTFMPGRGEVPVIPPGLAIAGYAQSQAGYYIVQSHGAIQEAWKYEIAALGAEFLDYIPDFAFKVRMTPPQAAAVAALDSVAWVGLFHPAYKLSHDLLRDGTNLYRIKVERGADTASVISAIFQSGARVLQHNGPILLVATNADQLEAIAHVLDVAWVENFLLNERHNEYGAGGIVESSVANANGYDGST